jgi:O-methyltransferase domain/Dimerisation domain
MALQATTEQPRTKELLSQYQGRRAVSNQGNLQARPVPPSALAGRLAMGYIASQAVSVATKLGVADVLGKGALTSREIARATQTQPSMMHRLLRALAAFDVVKDLGSERFELTPVGDSLRADAPNSIRSLILMVGSDSWWQAFNSLDACLRTGQNAYEVLYGLESSFAYYEKHPDAARIFDDAMSANSALVGATAAKAYDFSGVSRIVDVGGGHGKVLASILKAFPNLRGVLFDLPRVVERASAFLASEGVAERCEAVGGDMFVSAPADGDVYVLSHVIHDWDDEHSIQVLQTCRRAMAPSAKLLILDRVMPERIEPNSMIQGYVLLDLRMMVGTVGGRERTAEEFKSLLGAANLQMARIIPTPAPVSVIEAMPL